MGLPKRRTAVVAALVVALISITPSYLRAFVILGDSDAPAFITGDRVLVNLAAYDLRIPYADSRLARLADPVPGDVILFRLGDGSLVTKRVIAGPGASLSLRGHQVVIDGVALEYAAIPPEDETRIRRGQVGPVIQVERGNGPEVYVSFDPAKADPDTTVEFDVPEGAYFVLGSNRDASADSRQFGAVPRDRILGKVVTRL